MPCRSIIWNACCGRMRSLAMMCVSLGFGIRRAMTGASSRLNPTSKAKRQRWSNSVLHLRRSVLKFCPGAALGLHRLAGRQEGWHRRLGHPSCQCPHQRGWPARAFRCHADAFTHRVNQWSAGLRARSTSPAQPASFQFGAALKLRIGRLTTPCRDPLVPTVCDLLRTRRSALLGCCRRNVRVTEPR
jgi:hypothetical protein